MANSLDFTAAYPDLFVLAERAAMRILHDQTAAEDVAAETMVKALASWSKVSAYPRPWVTRVAVNHAIDVVRRSVRSGADHRDRPRSGEQDGRTATDVTVLDRIDLVAALSKLSKRQREAVALRYLVGLNDEEAAKVLQVGTETVRSHTRRALQALRLELTDSEELRHVAQ